MKIHSTPTRHFPIVCYTANTNLVIMGARCPKSCRTKQCIFIGIIFVLLFLAILIPIVHFASKKRVITDHRRWTPQCPVSKKSHMDPVVDCHPDTGATRESCEKRGCCWLPDYRLAKRLPRCVFPKNYGYVAVGNEESFANGREIKLKRLNTPERYGDDIRMITLRIEEQTPYRLRLKYYDPNEDRFEVPESVIPLKQNGGIKNSSNSTLYALSYDKSEVPFNIRVRRASDDLVIFDTSLGGFTFAYRYLQITTRLPFPSSKNRLYGLGGLSRRIETEDEKSFHHFYHVNPWRTWTLFASDATLRNGHNSHGAHPMYLFTEEGGNAHGLLFMNSYPMEIQHQPTPAVTFRSIGGVMDIYLFLGPTPDQVIQQYTEIVGRPFMPPYWALGLNLLLPKLSYPNQAVQAVETMRRYNLTFDSVTIDAEDLYLPLSNLSSLLQERGQRILLTVKPGVPLNDKDLSKQRRAKGFVKDYSGQRTLKTKSGSDIVIMPDFGNEEAALWWGYKLSRTFERMPFSGLKLDLNQPFTSITGALDGCNDAYYNEPPYIPRIPGISLSNNTLCMDAVHTWNRHQYRHLEVHNLYGHSMLKETARMLLLSRSTFVGSGSHGGHWFSTHYYSPRSVQLHLSIYSMLEFNLFGIPFVGASICDNQFKIDNILCQRWIHLGMFYPFVQFPYTNETSILLQPEMIHITKYALRTRYTLLPYLYTLFHEASVTGSAVIRPMFYEFPESYNHEEQFMWGPALMVTPYLHGHVNSSFGAYFPKGLWYDFYKGLQVKSPGNVLQLNKLSEQINLHVRGGYIIPTQTSWNNTFISRQQPLHLIVALDEYGKAKGSLYWDDGETLDAYTKGEFILTTFTVENNTLSIIGEKGEHSLKHNFVAVEFQSVDIFGLKSEPYTVTIGRNGGFLVQEQMEWIQEYEVLKLKGIKIPITEEVIIKWQWKKT